MYHHVKKLMYTVEVGQPDPKFGKMLLEQFGGAKRRTGSRHAIFHVKASTVKMRRAKDLLMDIGTEELSHLEVVGALIRHAPEAYEEQPRSSGS